MNHRTIKRKPTIPKLTDKFASGNASSAALILEDPDKWGGEEAGLVKWARVYTARLRGNANAAAELFGYGAVQEQTKNENLAPRAQA